MIKPTKRYAERQLRFAPFPRLMATLIYKRSVNIAQYFDIDLGLLSIGQDRPVYNRGPRLNGLEFGLRIEHEELLDCLAVDAFLEGCSRNGNCQSEVVGLLPR